MRTILHSDINNCYASIECLHHPELRGLPVAVTGDPEARHGIILAKNTEAKRFGVVTGETIYSAERKCPGLVTVRANFPLYERFCSAVRKIYSDYTDMVEPFGMDEAWLDVTGSLAIFGSGEDIADAIRRRVKNELGITVSVGVSFNKVFAKLGRDRHIPGKFQAAHLGAGRVPAPVCRQHNLQPPAALRSAHYRRRRKCLPRFSEEPTWKKRPHAP